MKRAAPFIVFVLIALIGTATAAVLWVANHRAEVSLFDAVTREATNRIAERLNRKMLLLEATAAIFEAEGSQITEPDFSAYFASLKRTDRFSGSTGLGFAALATREELPGFVTAASAGTGRVFEPWPETSEPLLVPVVYFEASDDHSGPAVRGFDVYSEPTRRAAVDAAIEAHAPRATGMLNLVRDAANPHPGFVVYAPVYASLYGLAPRPDRTDLPTGFVFAGFRIGEMVRSALHVAPLLPINLTVFSADDPSVPLYRYGAAPDSRVGEDYSKVHSLSVAGMNWDLAFRPTENFRLSAAGPLAVVLGAASLILAAAAALLMREQDRAHATAVALTATRERNMAEKDLMLQEMKHRIKNAIARILAIARQTAAHSDDMDGFTRSFMERLQAMATAQDVLTRSKWQRADLRVLLTQELTQVFGAGFDPAALDGPGIDLDERTTQALGLVFHELATNTLKYGPAAGAITIAWRLVRRQDRGWLELDWRETGCEGLQAPVETGFGTKLIDATVRQELGGTLERRFAPDGLRLAIRVPLGT